MKKIIPLLIVIGFFTTLPKVFGQEYKKDQVSPINCNHLLQGPVFSMAYLLKEFVLNQEAKILISNKTMIENLTHSEKDRFIAYQRIEKIIYLLPNKNTLIPSVKKLIATY